jgi:hypothetical protein
LRLCEEPKEDDYEELHIALLRDDLVEDATPAQSVHNFRMKLMKGKVKDEDVCQ